MLMNIKFLLLGFSLIALAVYGFAWGFGLSHVSNWSAMPEWTLSQQDYAEYKNELRRHEKEILLFDDIILRSDKDGVTLSWYVETEKEYFFPYDYRGKRSFLSSAITNRFFKAWYVLGMTLPLALGTLYLSREYIKTI